MDFDAPVDAQAEEAHSTFSMLWRNGVPPLASMIHARWWQLETWLRSLAYVELRAKYGSDWTQHLPGQAEKYENNDAGLSYMSSPDGTLRMAYLDVGPLLDLIGSDGHSDLFESLTLDRRVWSGRVYELKKIRKHIAHCRRPHVDDLAKISQTLRDLEHGAFKALSAYNRRFTPPEIEEDQVVNAWVLGKHPRYDLIRHADMQYDVSFSLEYSVRPWGKRPEDGDPITGSEGLLWHLSFYSRQRDINLEELWREYIGNREEVLDHIVFMCCDSPASVDISVAALDDPSVTISMIGRLLAGVLSSLRREKRQGFRPDYEKLHRYASIADPRVQISSGWAIVDESTQPVSIFSA